MTKRRVVLSVLFVLLLLVLAACGPTAEPAAEAPAAAPAAAEPAKPAEAAPAAEPAKPAEAAPAAEMAMIDTPYGQRSADTIDFPAPPELDLGGVAVQHVAGHSCRQLHVVGGS